MSIATKRITKRSIVGMRVSALSPDDGIYHPAIIRDVKRNAATGQLVYEVLGEDRSLRYHLPADIVAPGFSPVSNAHLKFNQPVFVTVNGREIRAIVQKHRKQTNEVLLKTADVAELDFKRKLDDVRLLESMKISKLVEQGVEFLRLAEVESKKRPVSTCIEVPTQSAKTQKIQSESEPPMDDVMAAMVLTSLSGSPLVDRERNLSGDSVLSVGPMSPTSSLSSGYGNVSPSPSPSTSGHFTWDISRSTPSPASSNSDMECMPSPQPFTTARGSIPMSKSLPTSTALFSSSIDEGIDVSAGSPPFPIDDDATPCSPSKKFKSSVKTSYKCTWQRCGKTLSTVQGIERHIRTIHLRKKDGEEYSDHEEEFYYTEIDTTVESVSDTLANMCTSSSPPSAFTFDPAHLSHAQQPTKLAHSLKNHSPSLPHPNPNPHPHQQLHKVPHPHQHHPHKLAHPGKHQAQIQSHPQHHQQRPALPNQHTQQHQTHLPTQPHPHSVDAASIAAQEEKPMESPMELSSSLPSSSLMLDATHVLKGRPRARNLSGPVGIGSGRCSVAEVAEGCKDVPAMVGSLPNQALTMMASPMTISSSAQFTWCSASPSSFSFPSTTSPQPTQASQGRMRHKSAPHSTHGQPKIRSEGKKCRKVYGMENKDLWCTQCRWKKACVRFT